MISNDSNYKLPIIRSTGRAQPRTIEKSPQTKVAEALTTAINENNVQDVKKIIDIAKRDNIDMKPIVDLCLKQPENNISYLLVLKKVLTSSSEKPDLTSIDQAINQSLLKGFKKAIETNDHALLKSYFAAAEKHAPDTPALWRQVVDEFQGDKKSVNYLFAKKILDKFEGLKNNATQQKDSSLNPFQMLKICAVAEFRLQAGSESENQGTFVTGKEDDLSHSLLIDHKQHKFTINLNKEIGRGTGGIVTKSIEVAHRILAGMFHVEVTDVARKENFDSNEFSPQELEYEKKFGGLRSYANYTEGEESKTTFTTDLYTGNLNELSIPLSSTQSYRILGDVGSTLANMHDEEVIHGDLKKENILFRILNEQPQGKLIDFGMCYEPNSSDDEKNTQKSFPYYGTYTYTSPEVLQSFKTYSTHPPEYSLEDRKAQESYAFGCIVYSMMLGKEPEWFAKINQLDPRRMEKGTRMDEILASQREMSVKREELTEKMERGETLTDSEKTMLTITQLLHPDPKERMTVREFLNHPHTIKMQGLDNDVPPLPIKEIAHKPEVKIKPLIENEHLNENEPSLDRLDEMMNELENELQ